MLDINYTGNGKVVLIAGGGKTYSDIAASFCRSQKDLESIISSPQNKAILSHIINSNHTAALEFDDFIFGVEGYSRVTEVQLVRKRHASYMISSGRHETNGKRNLSVAIPEVLDELEVNNPTDIENIWLAMNSGQLISLGNYLRGISSVSNKAYQVESAYVKTSTNDILALIDNWYNMGVSSGIPEEDLRYIKPQATVFKGIIKMNATALRDWAKIRMCNRAQSEIRDLATKMISLAKESAPDLFKGVGPSCVVYGYCSESEQCSQLKDKILTKKQAMEILRNHNN